MKENITRRELLERVSKATVAAGIGSVAAEAANEKGAFSPAGALRPPQTPLQAGGANPPEKFSDDSIFPESGGRARSWEPGVRITPEHAPAKAFDSSFHTYWAVSVYDLPADLGIEWPQPRTVSSVVVRYFAGGMVIGPMIARTQQWARLQHWEQGEWRDIDFQMVGQETSSVRYSFQPLTTTRLRILFTEPPDPQTAHVPDQLGIYVCEFEPHGQPPFQVVTPADRLVPIRRALVNCDGRQEDGGQVLYNLNESDNPWDREGPLIVERRETKVFRDILRPTLIVAESRWAKTACAVHQAGDGGSALENGFLKLELGTKTGLKETRITNLVTDESLATPKATVFRIRTSHGTLTPASFTFVRADSSGSSEDSARLLVDLSSPQADVSVNYELKRPDHFYHKWLTITNKSASPLEILDITVSDLGLPRLLDLGAGPELTYPVARLKEGGFFECLETIYWDHVGDALTYYPGMMLPPGKSFESKPSVLGVYRNRGERLEHFDLGVRDWVIEYHTHVSLLRKEWPDIYLEGWSADFGVKQMLERPEWAEEFFATAHKLGVRFMDTNEGMNLALLMPSEVIQHWMDLSNRYDIGTGFWIDFGDLQDWGFMAPYYQTYLCKLSAPSEEFFQNTVTLTKNNKLRGFHWGDFWTVWPCDNPAHGHLPGKYSVYAQGQRMIRFYHELHAASPGLMLGADTGLGNPQYGRYADSRQHGGGVDAYPAVLPDIHLDRLYAEMNRAALWGTEHQSYLHPWFRALNCVNHFGRGETHHHDSAGYRYALLSAIAIAPQLTFDDAPENVPDSDIQFTQRWERWARDNRDYFKQGDKLFDRSFRLSDAWYDSNGADQSLTGLTHIRGDRGYVFLMNPDVVEQVAELTLSLSAPPSEEFFVEELYPGGMALQGPENGAYPQGGKLRVTVPAKQVRILRISPSPLESKPGNFQPEEARAASWRRYIGEWSVASKTSDTATLQAEFQYPSGGKAYLTEYAAEPAWSKEPWNYPKAYLVLLLKDEMKALDNNWVSDTLPLTVSVNKAARAVYAFKTGRRQDKGQTRCYFVALEAETTPGQKNSVEVTLPIQRGLVFSGAYLDLPDQTPYGENPPVNT